MWDAVSWQGWRDEPDVRGCRLQPGSRERDCLAGADGGLAAIAAYKRRIRQLLDGVAPVLDVGCGPGDDVLALGVDRCFGVDRSELMCCRASQRGAVVVRSDGTALPFSDGSFGGARSDRTLQHLVDPVPALRELLRVL